MNEDDMAELIGEIIERKRGDTAPDTITVPFDNTGFSYVLTVNTQKDPEPVGPPIIGAELVVSVGIITPGPNSSGVSFPWTAGNADQAPGCNWYDIQQTDPAGTTKTIAKNQYIFHMDVSK